ncbi:hypothetical protein NE237_004738 [Protea cynaroides]|uniref:Serine aminopeptidase S33 domain-containing protein n=1 Tax=Protea cynaroides TaxID=273540 RepID=A0A9Q0QTZ1_9MAGN|nr:hypothetical protein NE237_004738 [Protea cynaroides]
MHLWPSLRIRDSFKLDYLKKLEWNLHRMKSEKDSSTNQKLLHNEKDDDDGKAESESPPQICWVLGLCKELSMILSCCYCCFCCGACVDQNLVAGCTIFCTVVPQIFAILVIVIIQARIVAALLAPSPSSTATPARRAGSSSSLPSSSPNQASPPVPSITRDMVSPKASRTTSLNINPVVDDCISFFDSFRAQYPASLPSFLYAESLGGAIALLVYLRGKQPDSSSKSWDGVVLNGAMCGVSDKIKPPWPLEHFLSLVATLVPTWQIVPTRGNIVEVSFKEEWKRKLGMASPRRSTSRPRAATAGELLRVSKELQGRFEEVDLPLLIVHGSEDVLCDPACAEELYRRAASKDKTIRIYPGMLHQIIGEPQENVDLVFGEVVNWLRTRAECKGAAAPPVAD